MLRLFRHLLRPGLSAHAAYLLKVANLLASPAEDFRAADLTAEKRYSMVEVEDSRNCGLGEVPYGQDPPTDCAEKLLRSNPPVASPAKCHPPRRPGSYLKHSPPKRTTLKTL